MQPSDLTTTSLGRLSWRPWKLLATTVMLPSSSCLVTRRVSCSQATSRPCRSRVRPLARLVGSNSNDTPLPGSYFMRRLLWMSLNTRWPPSRHHSGPSAGPCAPPKPSARSWIGSDLETIRSSSGASDSIRFDDCDMAFLLIWPRGRRVRLPPLARGWPAPPAPATLWQYPLQGEQSNADTQRRRRDPRRWQCRDGGDCGDAGGGARGR